MDFRVLDIARILPSDICFVRQVLQHLSNFHIQGLKLMSGKYKYLVITEHLNKVENFLPNIDKVTGPDIRIDNSGVILTKPPFNLKAIEVKDVCNIQPKK